MAFIELENNLSINDVYDEIKTLCEEELPDYEVPSYFEQIEKMPYTSNGKYDFRKLEELGNKKLNEQKG